MGILQVENVPLPESAVSKLHVKSGLSSHIRIMQFEKHSPSHRINWKHIHYFQIALHIGPFHIWPFVIYLLYSLKKKTKKPFLEISITHWHFHSSNNAIVGLHDVDLAWQQSIWDTICHTHSKHTMLLAGSSTRRRLLWCSICWLHFWHRKTCMEFRIHNFKVITHMPSLAAIQNYDVNNSALAGHERLGFLITMFVSSSDIPLVVGRSASKMSPSLCSA